MRLIASRLSEKIGFACGRSLRVAAFFDREERPVGEQQVEHRLRRIGRSGEKEPDGDG